MSRYVIADDQFLSGLPHISTTSARAHERRPLEYVDLKRQEELRFQIQELEEIRTSVRNELRITDQSRLSWEVDTQKLALTHRKRPSTS